jgi:hypothetical protein
MEEGARGFDKRRTFFWAVTPYTSKNPTLRLRKNI